MFVRLVLGEAKVTIFKLEERMESLKDKFAFKLEVKEMMVA